MADRQIRIDRCAGRAIQPKLHQEFAAANKVDRISETAAVDPTNSAAPFTSPLNPRDHPAQREGAAERNVLSIQLEYVDS